MAHKIAYMVHPDSEISNEELDELYSIFHQAGYFDGDKYEYSGNFILTTDVAERDEALTKMCCGIVSKDYKLKTGKEVYLGFDYGH